MTGVLGFLASMAFILCAGVGVAKLILAKVDADLDRKKKGR